MDDSSFFCHLSSIYSLENYEKLEKFEKSTLEKHRVVEFSEFLLIPEIFACLNRCGISK